MNMPDKRPYCPRCDGVITESWVCQCAPPPAGAPEDQPRLREGGASDGASVASALQDQSMGLQNGDTVAAVRAALYCEPGDDVVDVARRYADHRAVHEIPALRARLKEADVERDAARGVAARLAWADNRYPEVHQHDRAQADRWREEGYGK